MSKKCIKRTLILVEVKPTYGCSCVGDSQHDFNDFKKHAWDVLDFEHRHCLFATYWVCLFDYRNAASHMSQAIILC